MRCWIVTVIDRVVFPSSKATLREDGCSGLTYKLGLLEAAMKTHPAVLFYENVLGVAEQSKAEDGSKLPALTQADSCYSTVGLTVQVCGIISLATFFTIE